MPAAPASPPINGNQEGAGCFLSSPTNTLALNMAIHAPRMIKVAATISRSPVVTMNVVPSLFRLKPEATEDSLTIQAGNHEIDSRNPKIEAYVTRRQPGRTQKSY